MEEVIRVLQELVAIPSVNPEMRPKFGAENAEAKVADYVENYMQTAGIDTERQEVYSKRDNVLVSVEGTNKGTTLLLEAHMDTVPGDTMTIEPFSPDIKDGKLFGRGSCDTKGSLAAMMVAVKESIKHGLPPINIMLAATIDEEVNYGGAGKLVDSGFQADFGIVGEPTDLDVVTAHKGTTRFWIRTPGITAHSSNPDEGKNAVYRMCKVIKHIERYHREILPNITHPLVGSATMSVGIIAGGQAANIVPDQCEIMVDRRTLPAEDPSTAWKQVQEYLSNQDDIDFELTFPETKHLDFGMEVPTDHEIVNRLMEATTKVLGRANSKGVAYGTDASKFTPSGTPCVVFGPGSILQAHAPVEFIETDQLCAAQHIITQVIEG